MARLADEINLVERVQKADAFRRWIEDPDVAEYFTTARKQLVDAMLATKDNDDMGRYRLKTAVVVLDKFHEFIATRLADGELAKRDLEFIRKGTKSFF